MSPAVGRWFRTLQPLKPVQIYGRLFHEIRWRVFRRVTPLLSLLLGKVRQVPDVVAPLPLPEKSAQQAETLARLLSEGRLTLAGRDVSVTDWANATLPKLVRYHLHYLDAARMLAEGREFGRAGALIGQWQETFPPRGSEAWEPYPVSVRLQNLCRVAALHPTPPSWLRSLIVRHARYVRRFPEVHLQGNHLLKNHCALWMAGLLLSGAEARCWNEGASARTRLELERQVLPDGGHNERSPMYHLLVLSDLLDVRELAQARQALPSWLDDFIARMARMTAATLHPDGDIPLFNDSVLGQAPLPAVVFSRLGQVPSVEARGVEDFPEFGLTVIRPSVEEAVFFDTGPLGPPEQPGHAHSDTLSYELSVGGERRAVNGGVDGYQSPNRAFFRSATAHNTVTVNGEGPDELWAGFRVGGRNRVESRSIHKHEGAVSVCAQLRAFQGWRQKRWACLFFQHAWVVCDEVSAERAVHAVSRARLLPGRATVRFVPLLGEPAQRATGYAPCFGPVYDIEEHSVSASGKVIRLAYALVFGEWGLRLRWDSEKPVVEFNGRSFTLE